MKSVLVRLNEYQLQMTPAESEVVQYILHHPEKAVLEAEAVTEKQVE